MKRPAFQFYPADWRKDNQLQSCSLAAQGFWMNAMCIAHECEPYGHLISNGKPMQPQQLGKLIGVSGKEADKLIKELERYGVVSRCEDGCLFSRRMVRDEQLRMRRAEFGELGSEFGGLGAKYGKRGGRPKKPPLKPPLEETEGGLLKPPNELFDGGFDGGIRKPPPSSSSSSSPTKEKTKTKNSEPIGSDGSPSNTDTETIFANGVALMQSAGVSDKNARSMLGLMRKQHGEKAVADALRRCAEVQAIEPVAWLQAALKSKSGQPSAKSIAAEAMRLDEEREKHEA